MNDIIEKAKKLMALRDRAGTRGEAEAAARALAALLDKHRISMVELEQKSGAAESIVTDDEPLIVWHRAAAWRRELINTLSDHYGVAWWRCRVFTGYDRSNARRYKSVVHLCGRPSDIALVRYMFAWLSSELTRIGAAECKGRGHGYKNSWMLGFAEGITAQLMAARKEVAEVAGDAALVLHTRLDEAHKALYEQVPGLTTTGYSASIRPSAHRAGKERGRAHHLGQSLDTGHVRALPMSSSTS